MSCGAEPPQNRKMADLRADFYKALNEYLKEVTRRFPQYGVGVHETLRTRERQRWLWNHGRVAGCGTAGRHITWTLDSNHFYGIAADWHLSQNGKAIWDTTKPYEQVYRTIPLGDYDLESLAPTEWVHLQLKDANNRRFVAQRNDVIQLGDWMVRSYPTEGKDVLVRVDSDGKIIHVRKSD
jgi:hypothetical protein